jgi:TPR repeat protein
VTLASEGNRAAQHLLGHFYMAGIGVNQDEEQGVTWLEQASEGGNVASVYQLYLYFAMAGSERGRIYYQRLKELGHPAPCDERYEESPSDQTPHN